MNENENEYLYILADIEQSIVCQVKEVLRSETAIDDECLEELKEIRLRLGELHSKIEIEIPF